MALPMLDAMLPARARWPPRRAPRKVADAHGFPFRAERRAHAGLDAAGQRRGFRSALHSSAAPAAQERAARHQRPGAGQGPLEQRRRRRSCALGGKLAHLLPAAEERRLADSRGHFGGPDGRAAHRPADALRFAGDWASKPGRQGGKCDTGYSCAYSNNISWRNESTPMTREINPRLVFERLFSNARAQGSEREPEAPRSSTRRASSISSSRTRRRCARKVGGNDRQKLDEYLTSVREIEQRVEQAEKAVASANTSVATGYEIPEGIPESYEEHARLMADMMVLAFQSDTTRVCTFMLANEGSNRSYQEHRRRRWAPLALAPPGRPREADEDPRDQPLPHPAVRLSARAAELDPRGRRHTARPLDARLRRRHWRMATGTITTICRSSWRAAATARSPRAGT